MVMLALQTHRNQAYVLEYACKALAGMAEGIPDTILLSSREHICDELLTTLNNSVNMEGVQFATMEALCEFCSRDDYFDDQLFIANAGPSIVEAMAQHVHSGDVQQAGCKLLWLLSCKNDEYKQVLGSFGRHPSHGFGTACTHYVDGRRERGLDGNKARSKDICQQGYPTTK